MKSHIKIKIIDNLRLQYTKKITGGVKRQNKEKIEIKEENWIYSVNERYFGNSTGPPNRSLP